MRRFISAIFGTLGFLLVVSHALDAQIDREPCPGKSSGVQARAYTFATPAGGSLLVASDMQRKKILCETATGPVTSSDRRGAEKQVLSGHFQHLQSSDLTITTVPNCDQLWDYCFNDVVPDRAACREYTALCTASE